MNHRPVRHRLLLGVSAALVVACTVLVSGAAADSGNGKGRLFTFAGEVLTAPGPNATSLSVRIETGNRPALRALIGSPQDQSFTLDSGTAVLIWANGVPHTGSTADLKQGDTVTIRIRAARDSTLQELEAQAAAAVADRAAATAHGPLWLFVGTVAGPQSGGTIALHVESGNWKALHAMLGQSLDQRFAYDDGTVFLLWQGRVPTVIDASQLKAGDRVTVRTRAPLGSSLGEVEAVPAAHVGDHEPAPPTGT